MTRKGNRNDRNANEVCAYEHRRYPENSFGGFSQSPRYQPTGRDSKGLWFYSPYRNERKPSFHVNPRKNLWFDFGSGLGGDIFNLAGELTGETDFIRRAEFIAQKMQLPVEKPYKPVPFVEQPTFENVEISRLESPILLNYLADRGIPRDIAQRYCVQVDYTLHGKRYYAIGFENNAHGYELRNSVFQGSISAEKHHAYRQRQPSVQRV